MRPEFASFRIAELLRQLEIEFAPLARAKGLELTFVPCSLAVRSDRRLLRRLLQNLISNAIKYTPQGACWSAAGGAATRLRIEVYDTGLGIPQDKRREIFVEFHRLDQGAQIARGLGPRPVHRRAHRARARPPDRGDTPRSAAARLSPSTVPRRRAAPMSLPRARAGRASIPSQLAGTWRCASTTIRPSSTAWRRCCRLGLPGAQGGRPRRRARRGRERASDAERLAGRLSSRPRQRHRRHRASCARRSATLPAILITADRTPAVREAARAQDIQVLNKPVKPAALRALLAQWRVQRVAAAE